MIKSTPENLQSSRRLKISKLNDTFNQNVRRKLLSDIFSLDEQINKMTKFD